MSVTDERVRVLVVRCFVPQQDAFDELYTRYVYPLTEGIERTVNTWAFWDWMSEQVWLATGVDPRETPCRWQAVTTLWKMEPEPEEET